MVSGCSTLVQFQAVYKIRALHYKLKTLVTLDTVACIRKLLIVVTVERCLGNRCNKRVNCTVYCILLNVRIHCITRIVLLIPNAVLCICTVNYHSLLRSTYEYILQYCTDKVICYIYVTSKVESYIKLTLYEYSTFLCNVNSRYLQLTIHNQHTM